jgi:hypothetical protein
MVALALTGALAQAAIGGSDPKPDPKPLDRAIHDAVTAPPIDRRERARDVHQRPAPLGLAAAGRRLPHCRRRRGPLERRNHEQPTLADVRRGLDRLATGLGRVR